MKPYASLPLATGLAALAVGASVVFAAPQAKAICIGGNTPCATFNPISDSTPTFQFTATPVSPDDGNSPFTKAQVGFRVSGVTAGLPITFENISITGDGIIGSLPFSNITVSSNTPNNNNSNFTTSSVAAIGDVSVWFRTNSTLTFKIPSGLNPGSVVTARIFYSNVENEIVTATASTTAVPGPLPILGAASAFGFSRSIRRRIKSAAIA